MPGFSGQGYVSIAERQASGLPGIFRPFGNASVFELGLTQDSVERAESMTGNRQPYRKMTKSRNGTLKLVGDEFNNKNFALAIIGKSMAVEAASSATSGFVLPAGIVAGDTVALPAKAVTGVVVKDSSATPKTVDAANYTVDPLAGEITFNSLAVGGAYTQPLKADFTGGAHTAIGAFQDSDKEFFIRLKGVNTDTGVRGICDVFRVKINPTKALALINQDFLDWDLECQLLGDLTRATTDPGGQFFAFYMA